MDSALKIADSAAEEAASLYVLELLPPDERDGFERRLVADPALRCLVRELQGNVDAFALGEPERPAPLAVWGRITAEVQAAEAPVIGFPAWARTWAPHALAAAACLACGAWLHSLLAPKLAVGPVVAHADEPAPAAPVPPPLAPASSAPASSAAMTHAANPGPAVTPAASADTAAMAEAGRLRERVRLLASQVEALNQVLTQQEALPNGVTRLHVFKLVNTNATELPRAEGALRSLPETLAHLATGQSALSTAPADPSVGGRTTEPAPDTTTTAAPTTPPIPTPTADTALAGVATTSSHPATSTFGASLKDGQPIGFYDPDTGHGAIALPGNGDAKDQAFVVWSQTNGPDGVPVIKNVGSARVADQPSVVSFASPDAKSARPPSFFVTLEPVDGANASAAPPGPGVGAPPPPATKP